jgi:F420-0:gamma-glutamyl ligase
MKILKYFLIGFFVFSIIDGQEIKKDGKTPKTFTYDEALEMLKARDAQWEGKLAKADSLIESQKVVISDCEAVVVKLEESANLDSLTLIAQKSQIDLLKARDVMNEKMVELVKPKWYENTYVWLVAGFILGKI